MSEKSATTHHAFLVVLILTCIIACQTLELDLFEGNPYITARVLELQPGLSLDFFFVEPECARSEHPALIVFPPGEQSADAARWALEKYWLDACIERGWVVASPIASGGIPLYSGGEIWVPLLMDWIQERYNVEDGKFHLAGNSAGGYSSFRAAIQDTARCRSILAMPGYPLGGDKDRLHLLENIPVVMFAGEGDTDFIAEMEKTEQALTDLGYFVRFDIIALEGHNIQSLYADYLLDILDAFRP